MSTDQAVKQEYRFYIGMHGAFKVSYKFGPALPEAFTRDPREPIEIGNDELVYPVSEAVWREWTADDEDDDRDCGCGGLATCGECTDPGDYEYAEDGE